MLTTSLLLGLLATPALSMATLAPGRLAARQNLGSDTQNQFSSGGCKPMVIVFARGTTESGNVGTIVGPPVFQAVAAKVPGGAAKMAVQGVEYAADIPGFLAGGDKTGSKNMADLVAKATAQCADSGSQIVMMGYSQGCQLVHNAAKSLPAATMAKVGAAVCFGDPNNGTAVQGVPAAKTLIVCHDNDNICQHGSQIRQAHLTYGKLNAADAADFLNKIMTAGASSAATVWRGVDRRGGKWAWLGPIT
ncbi:hypothetical protein P8C59_001001 [Phyllachora maydis]|uniref:cutinase n=1 Tax=Phyllachora maydis TaxID=1825666 RepID=A0AAD9M9P8_9PEZI|nr:hypothetical protein P8C59_001001 [Phyllachora maydis]